ncbi:MAG: F0F1 ATP synthase subunit A [Holophagaceae bacterium]|nr:F0F1 ATP synthase subunit A [Holophagaceae bacterium]
MEHHASYLATLLTDLLGLTRQVWGTFAHGQELSVLERYDHLFASALAALVTVLLVIIVRARMSKVPGPYQQVMEYAVSFIRNLVGENVEHHPEKYVPLVGTMGFFILLNNLFGLAPLPSGTGNWNVTVGCALVVFCYYNFHGMREHGFIKYWAHFLGPVWWLAPLMFPLEIIGLLSRILSHSLRLFGNIAGEHVVAGIFFGMMPLLLPVSFMFLGIFFGLIQTFVFIMLTSIYISGAVAHEH